MKHPSTWLGRVTLLASIAAGMSGVGRANGIIDPVMRVLEDDFSNAILQGSHFFPNGTGGGVFGFFNAASQNITEMAFQTTILPGLGQNVISSAFACNEGGFNPFFQYCSVVYQPTNGTLTVAFWGTDPVTNPAQLHQGVPTLPAGCLSTPDLQPTCTSAGHFALTLADSWDIHAADQSGGWSADKNPLLFAEGQPVFTVLELQYTFGAVPSPEPGGFFLVGIALLGGGAITARRRRRAAASDPENRS